MSIATINSKSVTWGNEYYNLILEVDNFSNSSSAVLLEGLHIKIVGKTAESKTENIPVTSLKITLTQGREHPTPWTYNSASLFYLNDNESKYLVDGETIFDPWYYYPHFSAKEWFPDEEWSLDNDITTITLEARVDGHTISGTRYLRVPPPLSISPFLSYAGLGEATEETDPHVIPAFAFGQGTSDNYNFYIINPFYGTGEEESHKVYVTIYPARYFSGGELNQEWDVNKVLLKTVTSNEEIIPITLDLYNEDYLNDFSVEDNLIVDNITLMTNETVMVFSVEYYRDGALQGLTEAPYIFGISEENMAPVITSIVIEDTNSVSADITGSPTSKFIANVSDATYQIIASPVGDATIVKYEISSPSLHVESTSPNGNLGILKDANFTIKVTDSNGYTRTVAHNCDIVPYIPLTANIYVRDASTEDRALSYVEVSGKWYEGLLGTGGGVAHTNSLTARVRYKFAHDADWAEWVDITEYLVTTSNTYAAENIYIDIDPDRYREDTTWELEVIDIIMTKTSDPYIISFSPVFDWSGEDFNFNVPVNINGALLLSGQVMGAGTWIPVCNACQNPTVAYGFYFVSGDICIASFYYQGVASTTPSNNLYFSGLPYTPDSGIRWQGGGGNCSGYRVQTANQVFSGWTIESGKIYGRANSGNLSAGATSSSGYISVTSGTTFYATGTIMYKFTSI